MTATLENGRERENRLRRERRRVNPEKYRSVANVYREKNREHIREMSREPGRRSYHKLRNSVIESLGGVCSRCGFSDSRALQIDHINGGGTKELRSKSPSEFLHRVLEIGDVEYQLLCANCNWIKRSERGEIRKL